MVFYLFLIIAFCLDMITIHKSSNSKDKWPYVISMIIVAIIGGFYLKFGDEVQIAEKILKLLGQNGGI